MSLHIVLSNSADQPIYEQISRQIKSQIISGELEEGASLPSIRKLAKELQVSVITTKRSYDDLENEGFIDTVSGKGSFVAIQNQEFIRETKLRIIEEKITEAVQDAQILKISRDEFIQMCTLLYQEGPHESIHD